MDSFQQQQQFQQSLISSFIRRSSDEGNRRARLIAHCFKQRYLLGATDGRKGGEAEATTATTSPPLPSNQSANASSNSKNNGIAFVTLTPDLLEDFLPSDMFTLPQQTTSSSSTVGDGIINKNKGSFLSVAEKARAALNKASSFSSSSAVVAPSSPSGAEGGTDGGANGRVLSSQSTILKRYFLSASILNVLPLAMSVGLGPRCVFVCGQGGVLLRSVDRCRTWRRIDLSNRYLDDGDGDDAAASGADSSEGEEADDSDEEAAEDDGDDDTKLNHILSLMMPSPDKKTKGSAKSKKGDNGDGNGDSGDDDDTIEGIADYLNKAKAKSKAPPPPSAIVQSIIDQHKAAKAKEEETARAAKKGRKMNNTRSGASNASVGVYAPSSASLSVSPTSLRTDIHHVATFGKDVIVVVGQNGLLAVSVDRGAQFNYLPSRTLLARRRRKEEAVANGAVGNGGGGGGEATNPAWFRDKTSSTNQFVAFLGCVVVPSPVAASPELSSPSPSSSFRIIFHTNTRVFSVIVTQTSLHTVQFSDTIETLLSGATSSSSAAAGGQRSLGPIGCVESFEFPLSGGSGSSSSPQHFVIAVTTPNAIHLSLDGGKSLLTFGGEGGGGAVGVDNGGDGSTLMTSSILHQAGLIRAMRIIPSKCLLPSSWAVVKEELRRVADDHNRNKFKDNGIIADNVTPSKTSEKEKEGLESGGREGIEAFTYTVATAIFNKGAQSSSSSSAPSSSLALLGGGSVKSAASEQKPSLPLTAEGMLLRTLKKLGGADIVGDSKQQQQRDHQQHYGCTFVVLSTDGPLVKFDFTALLHLSIVIGNGNGNSSSSSSSSPSSPSSRFVVCLENVQHTPFVTTGPTERVGLGVYPTMAPNTSSGGGVVTIRSNRAGVSTSVDNGKMWGRACHAYTGAVCLPPASSFFSSPSPSSSTEVFSPSPPTAIVGGSKQCVLISDCGFNLLPGGGGAPKGGGAGGKLVGGASTFDVVPISSQHRGKLLYGVAALW